MAGVDTVRGIAFQQAQAVLAALDVLDSGDLGSLRVEGADDVVDIERFTAEGVLEHGMQVKTRQVEYTWGKSELLAVMRRWASLQDAHNASFEFLTDGRLGPTGKAVQHALEEASLGHRTALAKLLEDDPDGQACLTLSHARIRVDQTSCGAVLQKATQQVMAMLPEARTSADAYERSEAAVGRLFQLLFERAGETAPEARLVSRSEIAEVLGVPADQPATQRWPGVIRDAYLASAESLDLGVIIEPLVQSDQNLLLRRDSSHPEAPAEVLSLLRGNGPVILTGRTGTGKSTAARVLRKQAAGSGTVVLLAHAETYIAGRLEAVCSDAVANVISRDVPFSTGRQALFDESVVLILDGVSEIPEAAREALRDDLRVLATTARGARLVLLGRDIAAVREVLPVHLAPISYRTIDLGQEQRLALASRLVASESDGGSSDSTTQARSLVAQVEHALGEAKGNPMLFSMGLDLLAKGESFAGRAVLYEKFIERMGARSGALNLSYVTASLGTVFASLLSLGRRYADPFEWDRLISDSLFTLKVPTRITAEAIDGAARRCGLIVPIGYTQTVAPFHDSFADYLAGKAHAASLVPWPSQLSSADDQRLLFAAETGGVSAELATEVIRSRPFLSARLAKFDSNEFGGDSPARIAEMLRTLTNDPEVGVKLCRTQDGRIMAFRVGEASSFWIAEQEAAQLSYLCPASVVVGGPLTVVAGLWRTWIREKLVVASTAAPQPTDFYEAITRLKAHALEVATIARKYIEEVAPPGHADELLAAVGPLGMRAEVQNRRGGDWPVHYVPNDTVSVTEAIGDTDELSGGRSTVRHLLSVSPAQEARERILKALDDLTYPRWASRR